MHPRLVLLSCLVAAPLAAQTATQTTTVRTGPCPAKAASPIPDADKAYAAGDNAMAESLYLAKLPAPAAYLGVVNAQIAQDQLPAALATAQKFIAASPNSAEAQALLGQVMLRSGQVPEAAVPVQKAYTLDHCSGRAILGFANFNMLTGRRLSAARELFAAHAAEPGDPEITAAYAMIVPDDDFRATTLKTLLASSPALPPGEVARLRAQQLIAEGHKDCIATYPNKPVKVDILPVMTYGTHPRSWGIKVKVNADTLGDVEFDSGVSGIVLNAKDAKSVGVHALTDPPSTGEPYYAIADAIQIGEVTYKNCAVRVASAEQMANANSLIGADFFRERLIHIDYVDRSITLTPYAAPATTALDRTTPDAEKTWPPAYVADGSFLVPAMINKTGPVIMMIGTGSNVSVYAPGAIASQLGARVDNAFPAMGRSGEIIKVYPREGTGDDNHALVTGPHGEIIKLAVPNKNPDIKFAGTDRLDRDALSYDITPKERELGIDVAGIIGFSVLHEYAIDLDYRNNLIHLTPDNNQLYDKREYERKN